MGDGSSKIPMFSGEGYLDWSKKMKKYLISEGVWSCVKEGFKMSGAIEEMSGKQLKEMKQEMVNDANALFIIRKSLSPQIIVNVVHAKTAKEVWDTLHHIFMSNKEIIEPSSHGSNDRSFFKKIMQEAYDDESTDDSSYTQFDVGDDYNEVMPLSGDKPFFDMVITQSALKPLCQLKFPSKWYSLLPSHNVQACVRFFGQVYKIYFYGARKEKAFGSGWRKLVGDHNLEEGDFLVFEIMKCDEYTLEMNMQLLKSTLPHELEQKIKKRQLAAANKRKVITDLPGPSTSDEEE